MIVTNGPSKALREHLDKCEVKKRPKPMFLLLWKLKWQIENQ